MIEHGVGITCRIVSMLSAGRSHLNRDLVAASRRPHHGPRTVAT